MSKFRWGFFPHKNTENATKQASIFCQFLSDVLNKKGLEFCLSSSELHCEFHAVYSVNLGTTDEVSANHCQRSQSAKFLLYGQGLRNEKEPVDLNRRSESLQTKNTEAKKPKINDR